MTICTQVEILQQAGKGNLVEWRLAVDRHRLMHLNYDPNTGVMIHFHSKSFIAPTGIDVSTIRQTTSSRTGLQEVSSSFAGIVCVHK